MQTNIREANILIITSLTYYCFIVLLFISYQTSEKKKWWKTSIGIVGVILTLSMFGVGLTKKWVGHAGANAALGTKEQ